MLFVTICHHRYVTFLTFWFFLGKLQPLTMNNSCNSCRQYNIMCIIAYYFPIVFPAIRLRGGFLTLTRDEHIHIGYSNTFVPKLC